MSIVVTKHDWRFNGLTKVTEWGPTDAVDYKIDTLEDNTIRVRSEWCNFWIQPDRRSVKVQALENPTEEKRALHFLAVGRKMGNASFYVHQKGREAQPK